MTLQPELVGKTFGSYMGMSAVYIRDEKVSQGFQTLMRHIPRDLNDHIIYGRRTDGEYIGISQPYPFGAKAVIKAEEYCQIVGLKMIIVGSSTWHNDCTRILFQKDEKNSDRFKVAIGSSRWHHDQGTIYSAGFACAVVRRLKAKGLIE